MCCGSIILFGSDIFLNQFIFLKAVWFLYVYIEPVFFLNQFVFF